MYHFPSVSLLVTHYNRSKSLENLLLKISQECVFGEIIVSDDSSAENHFQNVLKLQSLYNFKLIKAEENKGLGNNLNKGQDAVSNEYTLYIQEDFEPKRLFPLKLKEALSYMELDKTLDYVRFYAYYTYPYLQPYAKGFSKMYIKPFALDYTKIYSYSDHPHLRRSTFFEKFGRYQEGYEGDRTEYRMCISFIQNKGTGLFYNDFNELLVQKNTSAEPSTMIRKSWRHKNGPAIRLIRNFYRQIKYNYDILTMKNYKA